MTSTPIVILPDVLFGVSPVRSQIRTTTGCARRWRVNARHGGLDGETAVGALGVLIDEVLGYSVIASLPHDS